MELLLVLLIGGVFVFFLRPLRDWYAVELLDAAASKPETKLFADLESAQQVFGQALQAQGCGGGPAKIQLRHVEARSRKDALKALEDGGDAVRLLQSADIHETACSKA